jgi:hypothetical protein
MVMVCVCTIFIAGLEADVGEDDAPHEGEANSAWHSVACDDATTPTTAPP